MSGVSSGSEKRSRMAEINLLKNEFQNRSGLLSTETRYRPVLAVAVALLVLEILAYGGLWLYERQLGKNLLETERKAADIDLELSKIDEERQEAISFQSRLADFRTLLTSHLFWSRAFAELEDFTYEPAVYQDIQANESENKIILTGTIPNYTDLAKLMLGLRTSPKVTNVVLLSSGQDTTGTSGGYGFTLEVFFDRKLILR